VQLNVLSLQLPEALAQQSQPIGKEIQNSNFFKHNHQFDMISNISFQYKSLYKARFFGNSRTEKQGSPFKQGLTQIQDLYVKYNAMLHQFIMFTCSISSVIYIIFGFVSTFVKPQAIVITFSKFSQFSPSKYPSRKEGSA